MMVLVDTCVWSLALRRGDLEGQRGTEVDLLRALIEDGRAATIGPIRQELLSGIRHHEQYERLRRTLRAFPDLAIETEDFERAAGYFNTCRRHGIQGSNTDFLICAVAERHGAPIFTTDADFARYAEHIPITVLPIP